MGKLVVLNIIDGDFKTGFPVILEIATEGECRSAEADGFLPSAPELLVHYQDWRTRYSSLVSSLRSSRINVAGSTTSISEIKAASQKLKSSLNNWLDSKQMHSISRTLYQNLTNKSEDIRLIVKTKNLDLQRLPWHVWDDFFQHYRRAEMSLSLPTKGRRQTSVREKTRILAVFGKREAFDNTTIDIDKDWELLKQHLSYNTELVRLVEPQLEDLYEELENLSPDLFFFAGHSSSEEDGARGWIELNHDGPPITIDDLKPALRDAVESGLQLAIFNSCDGLGIARELADLHIPQIIVMREPVPDLVAQKFLQRFLEAFIGERSVCLAVRRAREKIHSLEPKFPGVTWLPIVFQNPAEPPLTGDEFRRIATGIESTQVDHKSGTQNQSQILWLPSHIINSQQPLSPTVVNPEPSPTLIPQPQTRLKPITCSKGHPNPTSNNYCVYCGESLAMTAPSLIPPTSVSSVTQVENQSHAIAPTPTQLSMGSVLSGRYKIIQILGRGGFSQTYLAEDMQRPGIPKCVVKQLHLIENDPSACQIARRLFATEAQVLEQLGTHAHIPRLLAYLEENHKFYLVQELIEGHDLCQEIIPGKQMSESYVLFLLRDVLEILEFVHQQNVIHRDIKPSNLIRRNLDGKLVLIDFGAVKEISNQTLNSQRQNVTVAVGTSGYLPPEQMYGKPVFSSDIYALGMLCIEAITGVRPYQLQQDPNTSETCWRDHAQVGSQLARILDKMVRCDFKERYQSATEVLWDLKSSILPKTVKNACSPPPPSLPSNPETQINLKLSVIAALIALLILSGLTLTTFTPKSPTPTKPSPTSR